MTNRNRRRLRRALIVATVLLSLVGGTIWCIRRAGEWLVVEDPLEPAQAIVVLSGGVPVRAIEAARIYREGYAAQVWVLRPDNPAQELKQMGIDYLGEEFYNQKVLMHLGVPAEAILVTEHPAINTEEELLEVSEELRREGGERVILVTSKSHTRRVKTTWKALVGDRPRAVVRYASEDPYDGAHWWRHTADALAVLREVLGLANAWAGFRVRPAHR